MVPEDSGGVVIGLSVVVTFSFVSPVVPVDSGDVVIGLPVVVTFSFVSSVVPVVVGFLQEQ